MLCLIFDISLHSFFCFVFFIKVLAYMQRHKIAKANICARRFNLKGAILLILVTEVGNKFHERMVRGTNELK